ncbi:MAG: hypothetical protein ACC628_22990, partial [Pirellulaceae bacterium]
KFLFDNLDDLNRLFSTAALEIRVDGPTETTPRCEPALPTSGRGWLQTTSQGCRLSVRFLPSGRGSSRRFPEDQTPPRFIESPSVVRWCEAAGRQPEYLYLMAGVTEAGSISQLRSLGQSALVPEELVDAVFDWVLDPARNSVGDAEATRILIDVARGLPETEKTSVCQ